MHKKIIRIDHPRDQHWVGDGFHVSQMIPGYGREMSRDTSPFLMLDYNAPMQMEPRHDGHRPGVGYHPHRGFETVTIVYSGEVEHQDTAGNGGTIGRDEVQWMTAGSGLLHSEFFTSEFSRMGGEAHFAQLWVDLPKEYKMTTPRYQALTRDNIPEVKFDGGVVRVIAGELKMNVPRHSEERRIQVSETLDPSTSSQDDEGTVQKGAAETFSPMELYDVRFEFCHPEGIPIDHALGEGENQNLLSKRNSDVSTSLDMTNNTDISFTLPEGYNAMILVIDGEVISDGKEVKKGSIAFFTRTGDTLELSGSTNAKILIMAGKPLEQSVVNYGPFVMNTQEEIMQAFADLRAGKMGSVS